MFDSDNMQTLADKSVKTFNPDTQDLILIEEMSELTKALLKRRRVISTHSAMDETFSDKLETATDNVVEELTHVLVSCEVLRQTLGIDADDIGEKVAEKLYKYRNVFAVTN
jgi:NTP pyrophosphatase (non-canonical NTP hydrolase)